MTMKILALYGGAFNPYTVYHHEIAHKLISSGLADAVAVVPSREHRFKDASNMVSYRDRLAMVRLLVDSGPGSRVFAPNMGADEAEPTVSSGSTWDLAAEMSEKFPDYEIVIVIGEDNIPDLHKWYRYEDLSALYSFIVVGRKGEASDPLEQPAVSASYTRLPYDGRGSSSDARAALAAGDTHGASKHLTGAVLSYIRKNGLYKPKLVTGGPELLADGSNYDKNAYPKACNTVDIAIVRLQGEKLEVLLIKRKWNPCQGMWAMPGGFVDISKNESLADAAVRELDEETGAVGIPVKQLGTYGDPHRDNRDRVIDTVYYALLPQGAADSQKIQAMDDAGDYQWRELSWTMDTADIAFDHAAILRDLMTELQTVAKHTPRPLQLLPPQFTWKQVEDVYKAMLGYRTSNIRRKLGSLYEIVGVGDKVVGARHRPASLLEYRGVRNGL